MQEQTSRYGDVDDGAPPDRLWVQIEVRVLVYLGRSSLECCVAWIERVSLCILCSLGETALTEMKVQGQERRSMPSEIPYHFF